MNSRILAENFEVSNDTWATRLNNNDLIIGASGAGKTSGYVVPNISRQNGSMIIADTKGNLYRKLRPALEAGGYRVLLLDFVGMQHSIVYNPLAFLRREEDGRVSERDIVSLANTLMDFMTTQNDPFWCESAKTVLACLIAYVMEALPPREQNLASVTQLFHVISSNQRFCERLMIQRYADDPDSFAVREYRMISGTAESERTYASIMAFAAKGLELFNSRDIRRIVCGEQTFRFGTLAHERTALFVNISDTERAFDHVVSLFYTQALQQLTLEADRREDSRLPIPVRFYLDDFATNIRIADFDKIVSVIRSREIYVSVILQSLSQLSALYGTSAAQTITNQFDHVIYLAGQDEQTIDYISRLAGKAPDTILRMPLDGAYVYERGKGARLMKRYDPFRIKPERPHAPLPDAAFSRIPGHAGSENQY